MFELVGDADAGACIDGMCAIPAGMTDAVALPESTTSSGHANETPDSQA
jgi:hypothetical protein